MKESNPQQKALDIAFGVFIIILLICILILILINKFIFEE